MSHVSKIETEYKDLKALLSAADQRGLERREQKEPRWWGCINEGDRRSDPETLAMVAAMKDCDFVLAIKGSPLISEVGQCFTAREGSGSNPTQDYEDYLKAHDGTAPPYEIGVKRNTNGTYDLLYDRWSGGHGLSELIGSHGEKLKQSYGAQVAAKQARAAGFAVKQSVDTAGNIVLRCSR